MLGVTPFGVVIVVFAELAHAGIRQSAPLITKRASKPHAFRDRFPPTAAPRPTSPRIGIDSHRA